MCCIKFSKGIVPFAITFVIGLFVAGLFYSVGSKTSSNEMRNNVYRNAPMHRSSGMCNMQRRMERMQSEEDSKISESVEEVEIERVIVKPTFEETIIINEQSKSSRK